MSKHKMFLENNKNQAKQLEELYQEIVRHKFYLTYQNRIGHKPCDKSDNPLNPHLSWSHLTQSLSE